MDRVQTRENDLRISSALIASEHGNWLKGKLNDLIEMKHKELDAYGFAAEVEKMFLHQGIKIGLEIARDLPETVRKDSDKVMSHMIKRIMGK